MTSWTRGRGGRAVDMSWMLAVLDLFRQRTVRGCAVNLPILPAPWLRRGCREPGGHGLGFPTHLATRFHHACTKTTSSGELLRGDLLADRLAGGDRRCSPAVSGGRGVRSTAEAGG